MSEQLFSGPDGIVPRRDWIYTFPVPLGQRVVFRFTWNAGWENEIWVCSVETGNILVKRGNYLNSTDFVTESDQGENSIFGVVGYHKRRKPGSGHWFQSPMKLHQNNPVDRSIIVGFWDEFGEEQNANYDNAVVTATILN